MKRVSTLMLAGLAVFALSLGFARAQQTDSPVALAPAGAITGEVVRAPTCGGPVRQGQVCEAPAQAIIDVRTQDGQLVAHFQSDPRGYFFVPLPPGTYTVKAAKPDDGQPMTPFDVAQVSPEDPTITSGAVERLQIHFDTGIR